MVAGARIEGESQILSAPVRKTIQSIKEIVGNHSDAEIYVVLQETNMDPNETTQKLLNQDPFHEVRRKRDKKKENAEHKDLIESKKLIVRVGQGMKSNPPDRGLLRGGYTRNVVGGSREFRVVRDNRINKNLSREVKPSSLQCSIATSEPGTLQVPQKGSTGVDQKSSCENCSSFQASGTQTVSHTVTQVQGSKPNDLKPPSTMLKSNHLIVGVYSSSSDPVHVPSPDSRSSTNVGAIKRDFGAVGVRRQTLANSLTPCDQSNSLSTSHLGKDGTFSRGAFKSVTVTSTSIQPSQTSRSESLLPSISADRYSSSNQYNSRSHQQVVGQQKASQSVWRPKSGSKPEMKDRGVIGAPELSVSHPADNSRDFEIDAAAAAHMREKLSQLDIYNKENVFIAEHIKVTDSDRSRLTFGSFETEFDSCRTTASESHIVRGVENSSTGVSISLPPAVPISPTDGASASKHVDLLADQVQNSGSDSPASDGLSENKEPDTKGASSPQNLDAEVGLVHENSTSFTLTESQQQQDPPELEHFSAYDPHTGYDIPYYRPSMDELGRGQGLSSPQEAFGSHISNVVPSSTIPVVPQQQQQPMPQMYQQLHVSPFANLMPYRQFLSPVYVPPMQMPGYPGNPSYQHPSNGNSFLLMPGSGSHLSANNLKYGIQAFKPIPAGSPTGFGNFASATGYSINPSGVVGGPTGLDESSRIKYKDTNLYVPSPQAETPEMWIQNPRELSGMQSASYYNIAGQTSHGAYLPPHSGHPSFNVGAQSSNMQFSGLYHPPQPPHHMGPAMGSGGVNVGMAAAAAPPPGAQVGSYPQQPQISHLNWTGNF